MRSNRVGARDCGGRPTLRSPVRRIALSRACFAITAWRSASITAEVLAGPVLDRPGRLLPVAFGLIGPGGGLGCRFPVLSRCPQAQTTSILRMGRERGGSRSERLAARQRRLDLL